MCTEQPVFPGDTPANRDFSKRIEAGDENVLGIRHRRQSRADAGMVDYVHGGSAPVQHLKEIVLLHIDSVVPNLIISNVEFEASVVQSS